MDDNAAGFFTVIALQLGLWGVAGLGIFIVLALIMALKPLVYILFRLLVGAIQLGIFAGLAYWGWISITT